MSLVHLGLLRLTPRAHSHIHVEISVLQPVGQIVVMRILVQPLPRNQVRHQSLRLALLPHSYRREHRNRRRGPHQRRRPQRKRRQRRHHRCVQSAHADSADDQRAQALLAQVIEQRARLRLTTAKQTYLLDGCSPQKREVRNVAELAAVLLLRLAEAIERALQNLPIMRLEGAPTIEPIPRRARGRDTPSYRLPKPFSPVPGSTRTIGLCAGS